MVKKRGDKKKKKNFLRKLPGILWFVLGVVITLWTLLWLLVSLNSKDFGSVISVILFGVGFYAMVAFILGTLIYYIYRFIKKIKKDKHKKHSHKKKSKKTAHKKKAPVKKKKVVKKKTTKKKKK